MKSDHDRSHNVQFFCGINWKCYAKYWCIMLTFLVTKILPQSLQQNITSLPKAMYVGDFFELPSESASSFSSNFLFLESISKTTLKNKNKFSYIPPLVCFIDLFSFATKKNYYTQPIITTQIMFCPQNVQKNNHY